MSALKQRLAKISSQGHQFLVVIFALPLLISATTGIAHRLGRSWFGLSKDFGRAMMTLHEGRYLGEWGVPLYVLVIGLGLLGIIATGLALLWGRSLGAVVSTAAASSFGCHCSIALACECHDRNGLSPWPQLVWPLQRTGGDFPEPTSGNLLGRGGASLLCSFGGSEFADTSGHGTLDADSPATAAPLAS